MDGIKARKRAGYSQSVAGLDPLHDSHISGAIASNTHTDAFSCARRRADDAIRFIFIANRTIFGTFTLKSLRITHTPKAKPVRAYRVRDTSSKDTCESLPTPSALPPTRLAYGPAQVARPRVLRAPLKRRIFSAVIFRRTALESPTPSQSKASFTALFQN